MSLQAGIFTFTRNTNWGFSILLLPLLGMLCAPLSNLFEAPTSLLQAEEQLYATSFDGNNDDWELLAGRQSAQVIDGEMVLKEASDFPDTGFYTLLKELTFSDFDLQVQARRISGDIDNAYGIVFRWLNPDNYYRFEISSDGFYRLGKVQDGNTEFVTQWTPSDTIHLEDGVNEIRIVAQGDQFTFYINQVNVQLCTRGDQSDPLIHPTTGDCVSNTWQADYRDDAFRQGKIGLSVGTTPTTHLGESVIVAFDNLVLIRPD